MPRPVPVTMGSPEFVRREAGAFRFTWAWFPPGASLDAHVHDRTTFATMVEGAFDLVFTSPAMRRPVRPCTPGTVFTEPAGERHGNRVSEKGARVLVIQPDPDAEELLRPCSELLESVQHFRHAELAAMARRLVREMDRHDDLAPLVLEGTALEMLATAARLEPEERRGPGAPPWLERAREFVHEHFRESPRIADVAGEVGVHPAHLARSFRREHGTPLGAYIRRLRLDWAADRLASGDEPIARIAHRAGYADQSHLTRRFKKEMGTTPAAYRRRMRS